MPVLKNIPYFLGDLTSVFGLNTTNFRYWQVKKKCPQCDYQWSDDISSNMFNLKKVRIIMKSRYFFINCKFRLTSSGSIGIRKVLNGL